jgi:hypothetical protein
VPVEAGFTALSEKDVAVADTDNAMTLPVEKAVVLNGTSGWVPSLS